MNNQNPEIGKKDASANPSSTSSNDWNRKNQANQNQKPGSNFDSQRVGKNSETAEDEETPIKSDRRSEESASNVYDKDAKKMDPRESSKLDASAPRSTEIDGQKQKS